MNRLAAILSLVFVVACNKESTPPSSVGAAGADAQPAPGDASADGPDSVAGDPPADADDDHAADDPSDASPDPADGGAAGQAAKPAGASCLAASECSSGICEGEGCGDETPGTCAEKTRVCTRDLREYCGCDGKTFRGSGSCPGQRYAKKSGC